MSANKDCRAYQMINFRSLKKFFELFKQLDPRRGFVHMRRSMDVLPELGTIIDVGVAAGTPDIYEHSPNARIFCVEPNDEFHQHIAENILPRHPNASLLKLAASDEATQMTLFGNGPGTTTHHFSGLVNVRQTELRKFNVKAERLDNVFRSNDLKENGKALLKIDTEGHELQVLRGATGILESLDFIVLEVSILKRFKDSYTFSEIVDFLYLNGFEMCLIADLPCPNNGAYRYADCLFARKEFQEDIIARLT